MAEDPNVPTLHDSGALQSQPGSHADATSWTDRVLVDAMRRGEPAAFHELYARFAPALRRLAHRHRAAAGDVDSIVHDTLTDAAMALLPYTVPVPRTLAAYLTTALRNRLVTLRRAHLRRDRRDMAAATSDAEVLDGIEAVVVAASEDARRLGAGPGWEPPAPSPVLLRLVEHLETRLTPAERAMLVWLAHYVPHRTIAEWLELSYDAAAKRATRLRARLREAALQYAGTLSAEERRELDHFFRRAAAGAAAAGDPAAPASVRRPTRKP